MAMPRPEQRLEGSSFCENSVINFLFFIDCNRYDLVIMEFTHLMDRDLGSVRMANEPKEDKYSRLRQSVGHWQDIRWPCRGRSEDWRDLVLVRTQ